MGSILSKYLYSYRAGLVYHNSGEIFAENLYDITITDYHYISLNIVLFICAPSVEITLLFNFIFYFIRQSRKEIHLFLMVHPSEMRRRGGAKQHRGGRVC